MISAGLQDWDDRHSEVIDGPTPFFLEDEHADEYDRPAPPKIGLIADWFLLSLRLAVPRFRSAPVRIRLPRETQAMLS
jgi:hypothetical protein